MNKIECVKLAKTLGVSHSAVSQWLSGKTRPNYDLMFKLNESHNIPFTAWKDIKSFISGNCTTESDPISSPNQNQEVSA